MKLKRSYQTLLIHKIKDVDSVALLESFRALKPTRLEGFRARKP